MIKSIIAFAITLALVTTATAQTMTLPRSGPITNKDGERIGTVTQTGNHFYMRDNNNELYAVIVVERDKVTLYDPDGKILDQRTRSETPFKDKDGGK